MKEPQEYERQAGERQAWAGCDPVTLIAAARDGLHEVGGASSSQQTKALHPLEEVISRFEAQTRAGFGSTVAAEAIGNSR